MHYTNGDGEKSTQVLNIVPAMPEDLTNCNLNRLGSRTSDRKEDAARQRWKLLAKALSGTQRLSRSSPNVSVRRFTSFGLIVPNTLGIIFHSFS